MPIIETEPASFTDGAMFDRTFDEGMALVEETARYLDGKGREVRLHECRSACTLALS